MSDIYIGLMSGTSLDGTDAVIADLSLKSVRCLGHAHIPFCSDLRTMLHDLCAPGHDEIHRSNIAALALARTYAEACMLALRQSGLGVSAVRAIGCHGQTIRHMPADGYTVQLNAPALLAELTGIDVVSDFRSRDMAAGGQGAPLVPGFHDAVFGHPTRPRAILNLGGMANLSLLSPGKAPSGFDCGPGNALLDAWIALHQGKTYDVNGAWGATGKVHAALLDKLRSHEFFSRPPPKSCGREQFNLEWLHGNISMPIASEDVQATLAELTARAAADALKSESFSPDEIFVCGGGAYNTDLLQRLQRQITRPLRSTADLGIPPEQVEALAFAWLAFRLIGRQPGNVPQVTGAHGPRLLGALWPA